MANAREMTTPLYAPDGARLYFALDDTVRNVAEFI